MSDTKDRLSNKILLSIVEKMTEQLCDEKKLKLVHCSLYGSIVYGTWKKDSDYDLYVIFESLDSLEIDMHNQVFKLDDKDIKIDLSIKSTDVYKKLVNSCDVIATEIMFTPTEYIL